ncbi:MAG: precorrin-8X methylmutase [Eubacterium sp.]|nr:precorrin-8X methylmutase [Eubacterium sp.]
MTVETVKPEDIEKRSFEIIENELKAEGIILPEKEDLIIRRCIHTSADFDYAKTLRFSEGAVDICKELIRGGADIITDTNMAKTGISEKTLSGFGGVIRCFMADAEVAKEAKERGITRAAVSMEKAAKLPGKKIFAVGNAPTALIRLYEMYKEENFRPDFIIGVPVGFVNVEAAKELIMSTDIPFIINEGRKGGSTIAAAICNALLYQMKGQAR